jgi:hypothetical protein
LLEDIIALFVLKASSAQGSVVVWLVEYTLLKKSILYQPNERRGRRGKEVDRGPS